MATLIDPATLRTLVKTSLIDTALQLLLDDADAEIIRRLGPLASQQEVVQSVGELYFYLKRRAVAVTAAVERVFVGWGNPMEFTLTAPAIPPAQQQGQPDFKLHADGYRLERLVNGDSPSTVWRGVVTLTCTPFDETASRKRIEVDLVKLALAYDATAGSSVGDVRVQNLADYQGARDALFRSLATSGRRLII